MNRYTKKRSPFSRRRGYFFLTVLAAFALTNMLTTANAQTSELSGAEVVNKVCIKCHGTGAKGAPKIGDQQAWSKRAQQGLTSLTENALQGIRNMPAHGGHPELSDLEIERAITYMVNHSGGHWVAPVSTKELTSELSGEEVVRMQCSKCHASGVMGAPRIGNLTEWLPRIKKGIDYLVHSAIHGHGGMPSRGGLSDLTDNEIRNAILYMYSPATAQESKPYKEVEAVLVGPGHMTADGMDVFLGVVSAQSIRLYPPGSPERTMHGGVPNGPDVYHVNVTIWNHETNAPVNGAQVSIQIKDKDTGTVDVSRTLERIVAGTGSYGAYVHMVKNKSYVVDVKVRVPATSTEANASFEYQID